MSFLLDISENLQRGNARLVQEFVIKALQSGMPPQEILDYGLLRGMGEVGVRFKNNEVYVPEVLIATRAMHKGMDILKPYLEQSGEKTLGRVVLATVQGDLHDIGKNLVGMLLTGSGFEVIDIGVDVSCEKIVDAVREYQPDIVAISALLTTTMSQQADIIKALKNAGLRQKVMIMVGGAPITATYARQIGADIYMPDAGSAAQSAKEYMQNRGKENA